MSYVILTSDNEMVSETIEEYKDALEEAERILNEDIDLTEEDIEIYVAEITDTFTRTFSVKRESNR